MSRYIQLYNIALRSWRLVDSAYFVTGDRYAKYITTEELEVLKKCDGVSELPDNELTEGLVQKGLVFRLKEGQKAPYELTDWNKYHHYDNRYFPALCWMITGKCNYNCLHCFNAKDNEHLQSEFSLEEAEKLIEEAQNCGIYAITITGGEPMLHPHFMEIMRSIYAHGMIVDHLNTNGYFITQEILDEFKSFGCKPLMKISYDGVGTNDWLRNHKGAEEITLKAMKLCVDNGFQVLSQTNVFRGNVDKLIETAKLLDSVGINSMRLIRTTEVPRWNENSPDSCLSFEEYYDEMIKFSKEYKELDCKMQIIMWQFGEILPRLKQYKTISRYSDESSYNDRLAVCPGNRGMISIGADGIIYPCMQLSGILIGEGIVLGNVKENGLKGYLQDSEYLNIACAKLRDRIENCKECAECEYFKTCLGGCPALAYNYNTGTSFMNRYLQKDVSKCVYYKQGYRDRFVGTMESGSTPYHPSINNY